MAAILLLEDEDSVNRGIEFTLKKEGYEVYATKTITEAEFVFRQNPIELMIADINLPDGNSLDFIRTIRKNSAVYVICLTALDQEIDQVMGYEAGADDYVTKPFSLSVLTLKVNAYFNRQNKQASKYVESGDLKINMNEMKAEKAGNEILFTKTEWMLLQLFLEHAKQILSKTQILEKIFDVDGEFVNDNTVAVCIRRLREKIESDAGKPEYIRNVRGLGYIWDKECMKR